MSMKNPVHPGEILREDVLAGVGTTRAWLAMQAAHDLAAERAAGIPKVQPLQPVA